MQTSPHLDAADHPDQPMEAEDWLIMAIAAIAAAYFWLSIYQLFFGV